MVSSVEFIPELTEDTMTDVYNIVDDPGIEFGVRLVIVYPLNNYTNCGEIFFSETDENLVELTNKLKDWAGSTFDRAISLIIPSTQYGTKTITPSFVDESMSENFCISFLDSIYKNNESKRFAKFEEGKAAIIKSRVAGGGKSKRAQEKKLEEERQQAEKLQAEVDALVAELGPDGYIIVECRVNYFTPPPPNDSNITISTVANKILGSVEGGFAAEQEIYKDIEAVRPSPINYIQPPGWLVKFVPANQAGVFVHDEVTLLMRQDKEYFYVLKEIEEIEKPGRPTMFHNIRELYLSSRLCDLSRPPELREIDTNIVGVKELFLSELLQDIWEKAVPEFVPDTEIQMKAKMVPIYDDFVKSFCFSRTMTDENSLENSEVFTMAVLDAMVVAVTIMYALKMHNDKLESYDEDGHQKFRWEFIRKLSLIHI